MKPKYSMLTLSWFRIKVYIAEFKNHWQWDQRRAAWSNPTGSFACQLDAMADATFACAPICAMWVSVSADFAQCSIFLQYTNQPSSFWLVI
jgi:hypothetical protein